MHIGETMYAGSTGSYPMTPRRDPNVANIAHPIAGARKTAVVLVNIISVNNTPITADMATGLFMSGSLTARFNADSRSVISSGSRIASRLKQ